MSTAPAAKSVPIDFPSPHDRPESDVVIYDGDCKICTGQIRKLAWWDCQNKLSYLSLHDPQVAARYPDLTHDMLMKQMYVIDRQGHRHGGAEAIRYLSRRLRRLWWLMPILHIPGSLLLWQWLYRQVANRRYRFGTVNSQCDGDACRIHMR
ncbi:MAG TPA: DUF393 domain-containing protein [Pirellulales bacterium]|jgi:predicted DCC family thiol-disulfide oxidoreductase YuxK